MAVVRISMKYAPRCTERKCEMYRKKLSFSAMTVKPVFCERPRSERVLRVPVLSRYSKLLPISRWLTKERRYVSVNETDRGLLATSRRIYGSQEI